MKRLIAVGAVVACAVGMVLSTGPARAQEEQPEKPGECTRNYSNVTMYGSKVVPGGATCYLYNVVLVGGIDVRPGGSLYVDSGGTSSHPSNVGPINVNAGTLYVDDSTTKAISVNRPTEGPIGDGLAVRICGSTVSSVSVTYTPGPSGVSIGGRECEPEEECQECEFLTSQYNEGGNHILGDLKIVYNNAFVDAEDNVIDGGVSCWYNNPAPYFRYNTVKGMVTGQCVTTVKQGG